MGLRGCSPGPATSQEVSRINLKRFMPNLIFLRHYTVPEAQRLKIPVAQRLTIVVAQRLTITMAQKATM